METKLDDHKQQALNIPVVRILLPSTKKLRKAREAYNKRAIEEHFDSDEPWKHFHAGVEWMLSRIIDDNKTCYTLKDSRQRLVQLGELKTIQEAKIIFNIKINKGSFSGQTVQLETDLDEMEINDLPQIIIERGYLDSWCNNNEYTIVGREVNIC